jgi:hypothetical protein
MMADHLDVEGIRHLHMSYRLIILCFNGQGLVELIQKQEARCSGNEPSLRQLIRVAGTVLLDIEITVKLVMQSKVDSIYIYVVQ